jgi:hypothetical protein
LGGWYGKKSKEHLRSTELEVYSINKDKWFWVADVKGDAIQPGFRQGVIQLLNESSTLLVFGGGKLKDHDMCNCSYELELIIKEDLEGNVVELVATAKNLKQMKEFKEGV